MITIPGSGNFADYPIKVGIKDIKKREHRSTPKPTHDASKHEQIISLHNSEKYNMMMVPRQQSTG